MSALDLLLARLPPAPCRILTVSQDGGAPLQAISTVCLRWESVDAPPGSFDRIVCKNSLRAVDPLMLFSRAFELLAEEGELLILGEFALRRTAEDRGERPLLKHGVVLAERHGFSLVEAIDTAPETDLSDLWGVRLLRLKKGASPRWRIGEVTKAHQAEMRRLFREVFGHDMNEAHWHWKYAEGRGQAMGAWRHDELIAHYGGTTREILYLGEPRFGLQLCDVMVKKTDRGTLSRKGPFFLVTATFLEKHLGFGTRHPVAIGFANERNRKVADRLGLYAGEVDRMVEVSWIPQKSRPSFWVEVISFPRAASQGERLVTRLWAAMKKDFTASLIGLRDWRYIKHRYLDHPDKTYEIFVIRNRLGRVPRGLAICRRQDRVCEILDLIGPLRNMRLMIEQMRHLACRLDVDRLYVWVTAHHARWFENTGETLTDINISIPANLWTEGPPVEQMLNCWWLMSGDTDFR
ncbi:MAG: GNAT family N-acetyltransferase [Pseudomonadota bacterium]